MWNYSYDHNDQLLTATGAATDGGTPTDRVTYTYDALGNRLSDAYAVTRGLTTLTGSAHYGLDGWDTAQPAALGTENFTAWADLNGSNTPTMRRLFGPDFGAPAARQSTSGSVQWYAVTVQG